MNTPIALVIEADEPALFYRSIADAEVGLETYDVDDGIFRSAFGPNGEIYNVTTEEGKVKIVRVPGYDVEGLKRVLTNFLSATGELSVDDSVRSMLMKCVRFIKRVN